MIVYRPSSAHAATLRRQALRLGNKVKLKGGGTRSEIVDGVILRAKGDPKSVVVTGVEPAGVWLFLHHQDVPGTGMERALGIRATTRGMILGDGPDDPVQATAGNAVLRFAPGAGHVGNMDAEALGIVRNDVSIPSVRPDVVEVVTRNATQGYTIGNVEWDMRFQFYVQSFTPMAGMYRASGGPREGRAISMHSISDVLLPEQGFRSLIGDYAAYLARRGPVDDAGDIPPLGSNVVARNAITLDDNDAPAYTDMVIAGAYVRQSESEPLMAQSGVFIIRVRRPAVGDIAAGEGETTVLYRMEPVSAWVQLQTENPEPDLVPETYQRKTSPVPKMGYEPHGAYCVGMAYEPPSDQGEDRAMLLAAVARTDIREPDSENKGYSALQAHILSNGAVTTSTLRFSESVAVGWNIGPEISMFGMSGILVVDGDHDRTPRLQLWHVGTDGVMRETGLHAAGWKPYTQWPGDNWLGIAIGSVYGQSSIWATDIGEGLIGVLAHNMPDDQQGEVITLTMAVLNAETGEFVEARGSLPGFVRYTAYSVHLATLRPQKGASEDEPGWKPAVLVASYISEHFISRDGGWTWTQLFDGPAGYPLYQGNGLRRDSFGDMK